MNTVRTPAASTALIVAMSLEGFTACVADPADTRQAEATTCPRCRRLGLRCRGFENAAGTYRILLSCQGEGCRWAAEA